MEIILIFIMLEKKSQIKEEVINIFHIYRFF